MNRIYKFYVAYSFVYKSNMMISNQTLDIDFKDLEYNNYNILSLLTIEIRKSFVKLKPDIKSNELVITILNYWELGRSVED